MLIVSTQWVCINKYKWAYHESLYKKGYTFNREIYNRVIAVFWQYNSCNYPEKKVPNGKNVKDGINAVPL